MKQTITCLSDDYAGNKNLSIFDKKIEYRSA